MWYINGFSRVCRGIMSVPPLLLSEVVPYVVTKKTAWAVVSRFFCQNAAVICFGAHAA